MAKRATKAAPKSRIVEAAGVAVVSADPDRAARVEKAMSDAITKALADGVTDPKEQKVLMMKARDAVLNGGS